MESNNYELISQEEINYSPPKSDFTIIKYCVADIKLFQSLDTGKNARYMTADQFSILKSNIQKDNSLTSVILAYPILCNEQKKLLVLSGNHRLLASIEAGLEAIPVFVIQSCKTEQEQVSIQLSHNAISGQDDVNILKDLYKDLDLQNKIYSGLTDDSVSILSEIKLENLSLSSPDYHEVVILFLPRNKEIFVDYLQKIKKDKNTQYLVNDFEDFDLFFNAVVGVKDNFNILNTGMALQKMSKIALQRIEELSKENEKSKDRQKR